MSDTIYTAMAKVCDAIRYIQKQGRNKEQSYSFVRESDVKDEFHREFARNGILFLPTRKACEIAPHLGTDKGGAGEVRKGYIANLTLAIKLYHVASDTAYEAEAEGQGYDFTDKAVNKAYTSALKNFLISTFLVPSGDDPERDDDGQAIDSEAIGGAFENIAKALKACEPNKGQAKEVMASLMAGFRTLSKRPVEHPGEFASRADAAACLAGLKHYEKNWRTKQLEAESEAGQAKERAGELFERAKPKRGKGLADDQKRDLHAYAVSLFGDEANQRLSEVLTAGGYGSLDDVPSTALEAITKALEVLK